MSAQFSLALAAIDGRLTPEGLDRVTDPAVLALSRRVVVHADPAIPERHCRVGLRLTDGRSLHASVDAPVGQPDFDTMTRFARDLAPEMDATGPAIDRLVAAVAGLDRAPGTQELIAAALACGPATPCG